MTAKVREQNEDGRRDWTEDALERVREGSDGLWVRFGPPADDSFKSHLLSIRFNPCVSLGASLLLFGFVAFCIGAQPGAFCLEPTTKQVVIGQNATMYNTDVLVATMPDGNKRVTRTTLEETDCYMPGIEFSHWKQWVATHFTWLYIGTQDAWIVFLFVVLFSKYGKLKMGKENDTPEFTYAEWFSMIFCCGVATGLFFFSVSEPIWHYEACGPGLSGEAGKCLTDKDWANRYSHLPANQRAQEAMNLTFYHWGLHGWVCYAIMGALLGLLHFRKGLPMTVKTCFYPLLGNRIYGFWGDFVDVISVVATTFGVCTSLGLGVMQLNTGIKRLNNGENWLTTGNFGVENSKWDMDSNPQYKSIWEGSPSQWRDANPWNRLTASTIAQIVADNDQQIFLIWIITVLSTFSVTLGLKRGIKWFSLIAFGMGMLLLWVIFVLDDTYFLLNLFVQTIGHYLNYILQVGFYTGAFDQPTFSGGADGRQEYSNWMNDWTIFYWGWWIAWAPFVGVFLARISKGRTIREFITCVLLIAVGYNFLWMNIWGGGALRMQMTAEKNGITCDNPKQNICVPVSTGSGRYSGESEVFCSTITNLRCHGFDSTPMIFDLLDQYSDLGGFLTVICLITIGMYFVTSSDSGSMVDDMVTANGIAEPPIPQRIYWALTEGLAATALLYAGRFDPSTPNAGLKALQAASIAVGLPYTFLVCLMCLALWRALQLECGDREWGQGFQSTVMDVGITTYRPKPSLGTNADGSQRRLMLQNFQFGVISFQRLKQVMVNIVFPFPALEKAVTKTDAKRGIPASSWPKVIAGLCCVLYLFFWILMFADAARPDSLGSNTYGKWNDATAHDKMISYDVSQRYGTFRVHVNEWEKGQVVVNPAAPKARILQRDPAGDRVGWPMRIAVFGWFFYICFTTYVSTIRTTTREVQCIKGNMVEDWLASLFFWPTVLIQCNEALDTEPIVEPKTV